MLKGRALTRAAVDLAQAGTRPTVIAEILGRKPTTICAALSHARAAGVEVPRFSPGKPGPEAAARTQACRDALADLARDGHSPRAVAVIVGCTPAYVSQQLFRMRRAGLEIPSSGRGRPRMDAGAQA